MVNSGTKFAQAHLKFFNDNGTPLSLPWTLAGASTTAPGLDQTLAPHARMVITSNPADGDPLQIGSAQLTTDGSVSGFIRFRYGPRDQEAIVPVEAGMQAHIFCRSITPTAWQRALPSPVT